MLSTAQAFFSGRLSTLLFIALNMATIFLPTRALSALFPQDGSNVGENYLRLYFMPTSPEKIQWTSPKNLLVSTLNATAFNTNHGIGHVNIEIFCRPTSEKSARHIYTGSVSQNPAQSARFLADEKIAFSISAIAWPGRLESEGEILRSIQLRGAETNRLSAITYKISESTCDRVAQYHDETVASPYPRYYGFAARPRRHEGAGCSAYGVSYLEIAGIGNEALFNSWLRKVKIPLSLMPGFGSTKPMTVREALKSPDSEAWASSDPHMELNAFDPDLMHEWTTALFENESARNYWKAKIDNDLSSKYSGIRALVVDATAVTTPTEPIFQGLPVLLEASTNLFKRTDITYAIDGSFVLAP